MATHSDEFLKNLREDFTKGTLSESDLLSDPMQQFELWFKQANETHMPEVQAMTLATVENNQPSARIVYLRKIHNNKFWFYGNYNSRKGRSLEKNPNACLNFFWPELQRQIRIEGTVKKASADNSDNYFQLRPYESKLGAWASNQSAKINSRKDIENNLEKYRLEFEGKDVPRPEHWGGWILKANYYEFWQGGISRLHDRLCYNLQNDKWEISRLAP
ncbi:MAG: pyridoxamine 5'-phosphate oxidase [Sphingobacteriaceae bacterium]|nr:pyridoxamine 5'-phosphate oxidase [Sphingobacteriaceae bacterium]